MFWSHTTSIAIKLTTFATLEEGGQRLVILLNSLSITASRVVQDSFPHLTSVLWENIDMTLYMPFADIFQHDSDQSDIVQIIEA
jgi:hypothetical protein